MGLANLRQQSVAKQVMGMANLRLRCACSDGGDAAFIAEQMFASALEFGSGAPFGLAEVVSLPSTRHRWLASTERKVQLAVDPATAGTGAMVWIAEMANGARVGSVGIIPTSDRQGEGSSLVDQFLESSQLGQEEPQPQHRVGELVFFYVAADSRGQGAGQLLMRRALAFAQVVGYTALSLTVFRCLTPARALYRAAGFKVAASFHAPGHWDEDDIMVKLLPPRIELVYFDIKARGECVRLLFAAAGRLPELVDTRIPLFFESEWAQQEWTAVHKPKTPLGYVPYLRVGPAAAATAAAAEGAGGAGSLIAGAGPCVSYVARHLGLAGSSLLEGALCDTIAGSCLDLLTPRLTMLALAAAEATGRAATAEASREAMAAELGLLRPGADSSRSSSGTDKAQVTGSTGRALVALEGYVAGILAASRPGPGPCPAGQPRQQWVLGGERPSVADLAVFNTLDECLRGPRGGGEGGRDPECGGCLEPSAIQTLRVKLPVLMRLHDAVANELGGYLDSWRAAAGGSKL